MVGHSLGGTAALELQKQHPEIMFKERTYSAPTVDTLGTDRGSPFRPNNVERYSS